MKIPRTFTMYLAFTVEPLGTMLVKIRPLLSKKARTHCFVQLAWTFALRGPGFPFRIHCFDCFLVSGVWKDTIVSSIVTISSSIARDLQWTAATN